MQARLARTLGQTSGPQALGARRLAASFGDHLYLDEQVCRWLQVPGPPGAPISASTQVIVCHTITWAPLPHTPRGALEPELSDLAVPDGGGITALGWGSALQFCHLFGLWTFSRAHASHGLDPAFV